MYSKENALGYGLHINKQGKTEQQQLYKFDYPNINKIMS